MLTIRPSDARGHANFGWLDTRHTFSFGDYYDEDHHQFRALRVINEDHIAPGAGFPTHGHRDMEIISVVLAGALEHQDSMGSKEVLRPGEVQVMTAGKGVMHSEYNPSRTEPTHLLQIWIMPRARGLTPAYGQRAYPAAERADRLRLVASGTPRDGALAINADADLFTTVLGAGHEVRHDLAPGRHAWVQVARGAVTVNGTPLKAGDGAALSDEAVVHLVAGQESEVLVFDLA